MKLKPNSKGTEPLVPTVSHAYTLGTAALLPHAGTTGDDPDVSITCVRPDVAAKLVIDATAGTIQRATLIRFVTATPGLWASMFGAIALGAGISMALEVTVNGTSINRALAGITLVGLVGGFIAMRVGQRRARRRAEVALRRVDGDHWSTARWEPGERHAVRALVADALRLPWVLPGPTSTVDGVRNVVAMLRAAERRANGAWAQVAKIRVVLDDPRSTDQLRVLEVRDIVESWHKRAAEYDTEAEALHSDPFGLMNGALGIMVYVSPDAVADPGVTVDIVGPDGAVCGTIGGVTDASALSTPAPGYSFRNRADDEADASADDRDVEPWSPGELSGEIPTSADVEREITRRDSTAWLTFDASADVGPDGKLTRPPVEPTPAPDVLTNQLAELTNRVRNLADSGADRRGAYLRSDVVITDEAARVDWDAVRPGDGCGLSSMTDHPSFADAVTGPKDHGLHIDGDGRPVEPTPHLVAGPSSPNVDEARSSGPSD